MVMMIMNMLRIITSDGLAQMVIEFYVLLMVQILTLLNMCKVS